MPWKSQFVALFSDSQKDMLAGGISGCVAKTFTAPLSRLTALSQVQSIESGFSLRSVIASVGKILREEGLWSLWKGNFSSIIHRFPYSSINFASYSMSRNALVEDFRLEETPLLRLGCGAYAGIMSCVLCYPLDLVRTRLTVDRTNYYRGMCHVVAKVMKEEGVRGMFRGLLPSLAVCIPNFAITYTVYGTTKQYFLEHRISHMYLESTNSSNSTRISSGSSRSPHTAASSAAIATQLSPLGGIICGGLTGFFSSFLTFPIDLIKKRMQVRRLTSTVTADSAIAEVARIFRTDGIAGYYRGIVPEVLRVTPMVVVTFVVFEATCDFLEVERRL